MNSGSLLIGFLVASIGWQLIANLLGPKVAQFIYRIRVNRLRDSDCIPSDRIKVLPVDFTLPFPTGLRQEIGEDVNIILHMGAESHVDNSIKDPRDCFKNNIDGTVEMLEYAKTLKNLEFFFYFSTDEVFGYAPDGVAYAEWDRHKPTNPYSASKSAAESICVAYENSYNLPLITVNSMNVFGQRQHPEKYIPKVMKNILSGQKTLIHSYKDKERAGSRFYIHARNVASAILFLFENGDIGDKYNIVGEKEIDNDEFDIFYRHNLERVSAKFSDLTSLVELSIERVQEEMILKSKERLKKHTHEVTSYDEFKELISSQSGFVIAGWDGTNETEEAIKEETKATIRCIPEDLDNKGVTCIYSGKPAQYKVIFSKSY